MTRSPVLLMVFNRPDLTSITARAIARSNPPRLYVAGDGPRTAQESAIVRETREAALHEAVSGGIETMTLFRDTNLGCKRAVEEAVSWFFEHEPEGIILEDDCVPSPSFFEFCDLMLDRYRNDPRVMHISGYNHASAADDNYTFSRFPSVWGWATWSRAWSHYPVELPRMTHEHRRLLASSFTSRAQHRFFVRKFAQVSSGKIDTWDFSWTFAVLARQGLTIRPSKNLIANIGVGDPRAAHTTRARSDVSSNFARELDASSSAPPILELPDPDRDNMYFRSMIASRRNPFRLLSIGRANGGARVVHTLPAQVTSGFPTWKYAVHVRYLNRSIRRVITLASEMRQRLTRPARPGLDGLDQRLEHYVDFDGGFFIEAGANDGRRQSNTYHLEKRRGWTGLLVEPIPELADTCRRIRPSSTTVNCALVAKDFEDSTITLHFAGLMSLVDGAREDHESERSHVEAGLDVQGISSTYDIEVPARTLSSVLDSEGIAGTIDLLSLDVEGYELNALKGLDFDRHRPRLMLVECRSEDDIVAFLERQEYERVARLSIHDLLFADRRRPVTTGLL